MLGVLLLPQPALAVALTNVLLLQPPPLNPPATAVVVSVVLRQHLLLHLRSQPLGEELLLAAVAAVPFVVEVDSPHKTWAVGGQGFVNVGYQEGFPCFYTRP